MLTSSQKRPASEPIYGKIPLTFSPNAGQIRGNIRYLSNHPRCIVGFLSDAVQMIWNSPDRREGMSLFLRFRGANSDVEPEGTSERTEKVHYFIGNDPAQWMTGLATYQEIVYRELWPGIDLLFYGDGEKLKYDVVVQPGARLDDIRFAYDGADGISLSEEGNLHIRTASGVLTEERPVSLRRRVLVPTPTSTNDVTIE